MGVIALEVEKVVAGRLVTTDDEGHKRVEYAGLHVDANASYSKSRAKRATGT